MKHACTYFESLQRSGRAGAGHALIGLAFASLRVVELLCLRHCRVLLSILSSGRMCRIYEKRNG